MKLHRSWGIVATAWAIGVSAWQAEGATLRIVSYNIDCADESSDNNITGSTHSLPTVVQAIGLHHLGANAQQVDVMSVEELQSTTLANFVAQLNAIYGAGTYAYDTTTDPNTGGGPDGLIYNTHTIQDVSGRSLPTGQTVLLQANGTYTAAHSPGGGVNGVTRAPLLIHLRPIGFGTSDDFYMYVSHARSTSDDAQGDARYAEAQEVRSDAKYNLPAGSHILYGGDWNLFNGSGENAYKCLTGQVTSDGINWSDVSSIWANTNQTQAYDPTSKTLPPTTTTWANVVGDNAPYLYDDATYDLTSRIDIQLPNALMFGVYNSQGGVQIAPDTSDPYDTSDFPSSKYPYAFEVFGNNGTTPENGVSTSANNHSLDDLASTVPNAATVYNDLDELGSGSTFTGSDHYPIFGDYNIVLAIPPPVANFSATSTNGEVPLTVTFTDSSSGNATNWFWNFGDGATSNNTTAASVIHTYTNIGVYNVTETVSGPGGTSTASVTVAVSVNVDGTLASLFGAALSTQTINSGFGDSTVGDGTSAGGSELDAAYGIVTNGMLYLVFSGNVLDNSNHVNVFIADGQPGQNTLNVGPGWNESAMNGSVFSSGFNASLMLDFNDYQGVLSVDQIILSPDGSANSTLGSVTLTNGVGSATFNGLEIGFNDSNAAGVNGNTGSAANATAADAVTTGFEFGIPLSALGNPAPGSSILVLADVNTNLDDYLSDQFLPGLPVGTANLGAGGPYAGPLPGAFNLSSLPNDWITVSVPSKTIPAITWPTPSAITYGTPLGTNQLNATSPTVGAFAYSPTNGTVLGAGTQTLSVIFTPIDTNDYSSVTDTVSLVVGKATPVVTWANPAPVASGTALSSTQLNATANVPGAFVYTPFSGTVVSQGTQTLSVVFTPTDTSDYTSVTNTVSLVVVTYQSGTIGALRSLLITSSAPILGIVPANSNSTIYQVTGIVTTAVTIVSGAEYYIQDATGGIQFYVDDSTFRPKVGDEVHATGTIEIYENALEFAGPDPINNPAEPYSIISTSGEVQPLPYGPILIPGTGYLAANPAVAATLMEGSLNVVTNVYFQAYPGTFAANKSYILTNASGQVLNAEVYTSKYDTGLVAGKPIPKFAYSITGVLEQYGTSPEWELITTVYADIVTAAPPAVNVAAALSGSGGANVTLTWTAVPYNYTYSVLSATNVAGPYAKLVSGLWFNSANGTYTDVAPSARAKYYQIVSP